MSGSAEPHNLPPLDLLDLPQFFEPVEDLLLGVVAEVGIDVVAFEDDAFPLVF